ncbi:MAG: HNH endonuclease [Candidatus Eisenbacteria bacterium]|uniref:HNH endonuclease n=1 Tax=Eiseniibacteriota bacterium TaxID=2212470 RepID=A0A956LYI8_UNCEI|nr:HNH endonuclease [Candidatus Eisenbacteria bacterium]
MNRSMWEAKAGAVRSWSDRQLLDETHTLAFRERRVTLAMILLLLEVERRELHLERYSSLFSYCTDQLGYSRSAAARRIRAARVLRDHPAAAERLADGSLNLTTVCLLSRVLTQQNAGDLLAAASGKSEAEVEVLVAAYGAPRAVRDRIRVIRVTALGNHAGSSTGSIAHEAVTHATAAHATVTHAAVTNAATTHVTTTHATATGATSGSLVGIGISETVPNEDGGAPRSEAQRESAVAKPDPNAAQDGTAEPTTDRPVVQGGSTSTELHPTAPEIGAVAYEIKFQADRTLMKKIERARILIARGCPQASLSDLFDRSLEAFLDREDPERRQARRKARAVRRADEGCRTRGGDPRAGRNERADTRGSSATPASTGVPGSQDVAVARRASAPRRRIDLGPTDEQASANTSTRAAKQCRARVSTPVEGRVSTHVLASMQVGGAARGLGSAGRLASTQVGSTEEVESAAQRRPSLRSRHVPAAVRDAVLLRDGLRCTFVGPEGRCPETSGLHLDHAEPWAWGGPNDVSNLRVRCAAHNYHYGRKLFGRRATRGAVPARPDVPTDADAMVHTRMSG